MQDAQYLYESVVFPNKIIVKGEGFTGPDGKTNMPEYHDTADELGRKYGNTFIKYKDEYYYLEIRGGLENFDSVLSSQLQKENLYKRFVLKLESKETIWKNIQKSKRKAIKKALDGVEVKELSFENINELYHLYCRNMHSFGSPPYSKQYFFSFYHNLVENKLGKMLGSFYNGKLVSALVGFCYQDRVHILIAVSDQKFQEFRPNDAMHWKFIECLGGPKYISFHSIWSKNRRHFVGFLLRLLCCDFLLTFS